MASTDKIVIRSGRILNLDNLTAEIGDIIVEGNLITSIESPGVSLTDDYRVIDASDRLLIPGLINTHTHGHGSLGKGRGDRWTLELLLNAGPWISGERSQEDKKLAAKLNAAEMVLKGCTSCYDLYFEFPTPSVEGIDAVAAGYAEVGPRAVIAPMVADRSLYDAIPGLLDSLPEHHRREAEKICLSPASVSLEAYNNLLKNWRHDRNKLVPAVAPTIPQHCSDDFLRACGNIAREYDVGIHMHLAESKIQAIAGEKLYGKSQTAYLQAMGVLGQNFVGAHCIWLSDDDIHLLADSGAGITHQPGCNLRLGSGIAPVRKFLDAGITVGIGTDGSNSSDNQNMFDAVRTAANVSRVIESDYRRWISAPEALRMATSQAARLIGFENKLGKLAPGYLADIVFLDLANLNYVPLNNPIHQIVNCEDSTAVDSVMIDGKMVLQGSKFVDLDLDQLREEVETAMQRLNEETNDSKELALQLEPLIGSYCCGLAKSPSDILGGCLL